MADEKETSGAENFAHVPGAGVSPVSTHPVATPPSTVESELAAGTVRVASQPTPTKIDFPRVGAMENPVVSSEPSGATIRNFSPSGIHDVNSRGE